MLNSNVTAYESIKQARKLNVDKEYFNTVSVICKSLLILVQRLDIRIQNKLYINKLMDIHYFQVTHFHLRKGCQYVGLQALHFQDLFWYTAPTPPHFTRHYLRKSKYILFFSFQFGCLSFFSVISGYFLYINGISLLSYMLQMLIPAF